MGNIAVAKNVVLRPLILNALIQFRPLVQPLRRDRRASTKRFQILQWGDAEESLQFLRSHQNYKHIKRMVLELEGRHKEAAALR